MPRKSALLQINLITKLTNSKLLLVRDYVNNKNQDQFLKKTTIL